MTNANIPERWLVDRRFRRKNLSDPAFRAYMNALMYAVGNRTEGVITPDDLEDIPDFDPVSVSALVSVGLWEILADGWFIVDFPTTQTSKDLLEKYERDKANDRQRKARSRKAQREREYAGESVSGGQSGGRGPAESPSTDQTRPNQALERGTANNTRQIPNGAHIPVPGICSRCKRQPQAGDPSDPTACRECADEMRAEAAALFAEDQPEAS